MLFASVIMSVYNEEKYICESVESILNQTFTDFEFIIIDDASTDQTVSLIQSYKDQRIRLVRNQKNMGLTKNLNVGIKLANGKYIIRMDGDDIAHVDRLEQQIKFMEKNPDVKLASCGYRVIGSNIKITYSDLSSDEIKVMLLFHTVLPHPGFIFEREAINKAGITYNEKIKYAQDYDFQVQVARIYNLAFMHQILFDYRVSKKQISMVKYREQEHYANYIRMVQLRQIGLKKMRVKIGNWRNFCRETREVKDISWKNKIQIFFVVGEIIKNCRRKKKYNLEILKRICIKKIKNLF